MGRDLTIIYTVGYTTETIALGMRQSTTGLLRKNQPANQENRNVHSAIAIVKVQSS